MNHYFRGRWRPLIYGYNAGVKIRSANRVLWNQIEIGVVHFVSSPKPWEPFERFGAATAENVRKAGLEPLHERWRAHCNESTT